MALGLKRRNTAFGYATAVWLILCLAVARLPEPFVDRLRRNRPLDAGQSGWVYRLLVIIAIAQAFWVGFVLLRSEKVQKAREQDPKLARMSRAEVVASTGRNAAGIALLTMVYGLSAFAITGERGGFWLFALLTGAQLAWYFRQVGQIASWISFQPEFVPERATAGLETRGGEIESHGYTPPIARGLELDEHTQE
ncbi:MAG: hypothetical protein ACRDLB_07765 [Actinomycetota bacterium]